MKVRRLIRIMAAVLLAGAILAGLSASDRAMNASAPPEKNAAETTPATTPAPTPETAAAPAPEPEPETEAEAEPEPETEAEAEPEPESEAEPANVVMDTQASMARPLTMSMNCSEQNRIWMTDDDVQTSGIFSSGKRLRISAEEPIAYLYVIWNSRPVPWTLRTGNAGIDCGTQGYFHELVKLPHPKRELTMVLPRQELTEIGTLYAFSEGELPDWVQDWEPPCETADILLFSTHSDDEFIFFGGLLPTYAGERGLEVQVAYLVDHYEWQRHRCHELLNGLWTAGVRHYPVTGGFLDGLFETMDEAIVYYKPEQILRWQVDTIRSFRPLVVVAHDSEHGEYGNWTHILNGSLLKQAVWLAADPLYNLKSVQMYGTWDTPKLYIHLYGDDPTVLDYDIPLSRFAGRTAHQVAEAALQCHKSQVIYGYQVYGPDYPDYDSHVFGLYRSLVGEDEARNDLMEHIRPEYWRPASDATPGSGEDGNE